MLPFGLSNAPSTFQKLINSILGPELSHCCLVYLDDILVFSKTAEEHLQHLRLILTKLQNAGLYAKLSKCKFALKALKFLGHIVDDHGISPDPAKVQIVLDWPTPTSVSEVRSFMGLAQYFRKFIQGFATLAAPLTALFKKDTEFVWSQACMQAFQHIKELLTSAPCLKLPDLDERFEVVTDASGIGVGGVLMQQNRPVAFEGRKLTEVEKKWHATEQEMLAVVYHLEKWRCYLEGVQFTVVTDHEPNTWFSTQKQLSPRLARWYEKLRSFTFNWVYRPGRLNVADPLSRNPTFCSLILASARPENVVDLLVTLRSQKQAVSVPELPSTSTSSRKHWDMRSMLEQAHGLTWGAAKSAGTPQQAPLREEKSPSRKRRKLKHSKPSVPNEHTDKPLSDAIRNPDVSMPDQSELSQPQSQWHVQPSVGQSDQVSGEAEQIQSVAADTVDQTEHHDMSSLSSRDALIQTPLIEPLHFLQQVKAGYAHDPLYQSHQQAQRKTLGIYADAGGLYRRGRAVCVPDKPELHRLVIRELHCSPYAGHVGMNATYSLISRYFYWPNMQEQINHYVQGCIICQRNKAAPGAKAGKLLPLPVPDGIWDDISMDFVGPFPMTSRQHDFVLVVVDRLSKMAHFLPCKSSIKASEVARLFVDRVWCLHGLPKSIVTDRGTQFLNDFNGAILRIIGTKHAVTSAYHPESDGQTERVNRVLGEMLRHYTNLRYDDWDLQLPLVEFAHNNRPSSATGISPFFLCYGKHPRTPMQSVIDLANQQWEQDPQLNTQWLSAEKFVQDRTDIVKKAQAAMESARQRMQRQEWDKRKELAFKVDDQVSLKTTHLGISTLPTKKLFPLWMGPFTVIEVINPVAYRLALPSTWKAHNVFHVSLLKPYISNGEAVDPLSFTLKGGKDNEYEVEEIYDYAPKSLHKDGKQRKVSELVYYVKWLGLPMGSQARQTYKNVQGTANQSLRKLAQKFNHPKDLFLKGTNRVPAR